MDLQFTGKCIKVFRMEYKSSRDGQTHAKHHFVLQSEEQYAQKACFTVFDEQKWSNMGVAEGSTYCASFNLDSHEWNGRYYTDLNAWRVVCVSGGQQHQPQNANYAAVQQQSQQLGSDIPF